MKCEIQRVSIPRQKANKCQTHKGYLYEYVTAIQRQIASNKTKRSFEYMKCEMHIVIIINSQYYLQNTKMKKHRQHNFCKKNN